MRKSRMAFVLMIFMVTVLVCTGCSKPVALSEKNQSANETPVETATAEPLVTPTAPIVAEWYFAKALMDGKTKTAEQLGQFMHITLREDGSAENVQGNSYMVGTWEKIGDQVTITFAGSASTFTEKDGELFQLYDDKNGMFFTHEIAGTYIPAKVVEATDAAAFDGTWNVKWIWSGESCQSVEYLQTNFGLDQMYVQLENSTLITDEADYGMALNSGSLIFATADGLKKVITLLDDGMLRFIDYEVGAIYYCEKAQ